MDDSYDYDMFKQNQIEAVHDNDHIRMAGMFIDDVDDDVLDITPVPSIPKSNLKNTKASPISNKLSTVRETKSQKEIVDEILVTNQSNASDVNIRNIIEVPNGTRPKRGKNKTPAAPITISSIPVTTRRRTRGRKSNTGVILIGSPESPVHTFRSSNSNIIVLDDEDSIEGNEENASFNSENYEVKVKLYWNCKLLKIPLRRFQKFDSIVQQLAQREKKDAKLIVLTLNDEILDPNSTPESINYTPAQFIYGRIMNDGDIINDHKQKKQDKDTIKIKIQSEYMKKPIFLDIGKTQKMKIVVIKCAEELKQNPENLRLKFDGDIININHTPDDLEFEGGEILDVLISKS